MMLSSTPQYALHITYIAEHVDYSTFDLFQTISIIAVDTLI